MQHSMVTSCCVAILCTLISNYVYLFLQVFIYKIILCKFLFIILAFTYLGFYFHCIFKLGHIGKEVELVIVEALYIDIMFSI